MPGSSLRCADDCQLKSRVDHLEGKCDWLEECCNQLEAVVGLLERRLGCLEEKSSVKRRSKPTPE